MIQRLIIKFIKLVRTSNEELQAEFKKKLEASNKKLKKGVEAQALRMDKLITESKGKF